jgi:hypothetical protein
MFSVRRHRRALTGTVTVAALAAVVGCSRAPAPVEIDEPAPDVVEEVEPVVADPPPAEPEIEDAASVPDEEPLPTDEPLPDPVAGEVGEPAGETQEIVVDLDADQKATLAADAERNLQEAVQVVRAAQTRQLSPEKLETLATVEGLVAAARDALTAGDIQAAATLANKAKLIAAELAAD